MSESKLVIPTPKSCSQCEVRFRCLVKGIIKGKYQSIPPTNCPLHPIIPNSNVESALAIVMIDNVISIVEESRINKMAKYVIYDYLNNHIKAELSKISAMEKKVKTYNLVNKEKFVKNHYMYGFERHKDRVEQKSYMYFNEYTNEYIYIGYSKAITNAHTKNTKGIIYKLINDKILNRSDNDE